MILNHCVHIPAVAVVDYFDISEGDAIVIHDQVPAGNGLSINKVTADGSKVHYMYDHELNIVN